MGPTRLSLFLLVAVALAYGIWSLYWGGLASEGRVIAGRFWLGFMGRPTAEVPQIAWQTSLLLHRATLVLLAITVLIGAVRGVLRLRRR